MPTVNVRYVGHAPAVIGPNGLMFVHGEPVAVPRDMADSLGPDFQTIPTEKPKGGKQ